MPIRRYKPTSPGRRFMTVDTFEDITRSEPERSLLAPLKKNGGRNNYGRITTPHKGGGHKRRHRATGFKRDKTGAPANGPHHAYAPSRSARTPPRSSRTAPRPCASCAPTVSSKRCGCCATAARSSPDSGSRP